MTALSPEALQLLDFLVAAKLANCRVTRLKTFALNARAKALRDEHLVKWESFEPTELGMIKPIHPKRPGPPSMAERARRLEETRAQRDTQGASGTARKASSASSSGDAKRIEDRAPPHEPAPRTCPPVPARPVDLKVNIAPRRDPTTKPETPEIDWAERERLKAARADVARRAGVRRRAAKLIEEGTEPGTNGLNSAVRGAMREIRENDEAQRRALDPVEQAKAKLQRVYRPVCSMAVYGGRADRYVVGSNRDLTEAQLLEMAGRAG